MSLLAAGPRHESPAPDPGPISIATCHVTVTPPRVTLPASAVPGDTPISFLRPDTRPPGEQGVELSTNLREVSQCTEKEKDA